MNGRGEELKKENYTLFICTFAFVSNFILFLVKLFIGLASSSISIFSDAINNMFDSLSGLLTLICFAFIIRLADNSLEGTVRKSEQFFSFLMSLIVAITGFAFLYSSLERLMYPTPISYFQKYLVMLILTCVAKILMFLFYYFTAKKSSSPIVKVMAFDSILDFFVTLMTVFSLLLSKNGNYALDAVFGIVISAVIIVSAVKLIVSSAVVLLNYVNKSKREQVQEIFDSFSASIQSIRYVSDGENVEAFVKLDFDGDTNALINKCKEETGILLNIIIN